MAYEHTNSKGVKYYLHKSEVTLRKANLRRFISSLRKQMVARVLLVICQQIAKSVKTHAMVS